MMMGWKKRNEIESLLMDPAQMNTMAKLTQKQKMFIYHECWTILIEYHFKKKIDGKIR